VRKRAHTSIADCRRTAHPPNPAVAATVVLIATIFATYHYLGAITGNIAANDAKWVAAFMGNFHFASTGTQRTRTSNLPESTFQQFWSLAVEEQFYVVRPLAFLILTAGFRSIVNRGGVGDGSWCPRSSFSSSKSRDDASGRTFPRRRVVVTVVGAACLIAVGALVVAARARRLYDVQRRPRTRLDSRASSCRLGRRRSPLRLFARVGDLSAGAAGRLDRPTDGDRTGGSRPRRAVPRTAARN
jgi:peptidoglycan/LPS O-acetylase OafA/YrhL